MQDYIKRWQKLNTKLKNLDVTDRGRNPFELMTMMRRNALSQTTKLMINVHAVPILIVSAFSLYCLIPS
jgi:hypothetical protein